MPESTDAPNSKQRLADALRGRPLDRPPVWMMRQAGRALPEYRALKEKHTFLELVQQPELACEVTLQPIRRFGFDAAILFSDILVINEALGQPYRFREEGGIEMVVKVEAAADVDRLQIEGATERLGYVADALRLIRRELGGRTGLLGFAGSPWTLACFMLEGGSAREFTRAKELFYSDRALFDRVCDKLATAVTSYLKLQIECGVDAVQIFDTLGGTLADNIFNEASARWIRQIIAGLGGRVPVIVFSRGTTDWKSLVETGADVLGVDWTVNLAQVRRQLRSLVGSDTARTRELGVQGNLDPAVLETNPGVAAAETRRILDEMRGLNGHIFNLGHGVRPGSKLECLAAVVETVKHFR
jgi:uroporphyrinogen decarboxylase